MKKLFLFAVIGALGLFSACSDDKNDPKPEPKPFDVAYAAEGQYEVTTIYSASSGLKDTLDIEGLHISKTADGLIKIKTPFIEIGTDKQPGYIKLGSIIVDSIPITANGNVYNFEVKDCSAVNTSNFKDPVASVKGSISGTTFTATLTLKNAENTIDFVFDGKQVKNNEALLFNMAIDNKVISVAPEVKGKTITFYVNMDTDMSKLQFAPTFSLSKGATSDPISGATVDFSTAEKNTIKYKVTSEDSTNTSDYSVVIQKGADVAKNSFEEWTVEDAKNDLNRPSGPWATSNPGIQMIMNLGFIFNIDYKGGPLVAVEKTGVSGKAAMIKSAYTTGAEKIGTFPPIPVLTSGSLFLGNFKVDYNNTLNSTQFGIPYFQKPRNVKGYFKYTPGSPYYYCPNPVKSNIASEDNTKTDQCALSAVLYEVSNYDEFLNGENVFTSDKIVAIAQKFSGEVKDFTEFDLQLQYKKEYNPKKKYRFAIIFSSSKDGDKFSGADKSTLVVDEVTVTND